MKVTVLCENTVGVPFPLGLRGEHGLSFLIEGNRKILYDTAQGVGIINNMAVLGKDVDAIDHIVISHGHYDHTGGLMPVLENRKGSVPVYLHKEAFKKKVALVEMPKDSFELPIGFQYSQKEYEEKGAEFNFINNYTEIGEGVYALSDVERPLGWKTWDTRLKCKDGENTIDDPFNDDLTLLLETGSGPVVLLGCAHAGIVEILNDLSNKTGHKEFFAVIGGTHLGTATDDYIEKAIETMKNYKVKVVGPSHCTGPVVSATIMSKFKNEFTHAAVGSVYDF